jgi:hypothetical protein
MMPTLKGTMLWVLRMVLAAGELMRVNNIFFV